MRTIRRSSASVAAAALSGTTVRSIQTPPSRKAVQLKQMAVDPNVRYPTVFHGLTYTSQLFGAVDWTTDNQRELLSHIWNRDCFLPTKPAAALDGTPFKVLSDVGAKQAIVLLDRSEGLLAQNKLRETVKREIVDKEDTQQLHRALLQLLQQFRAAPTAEIAQTVSNVAFWCQWLIRGVLFEGKLFEQKYTDAIIPAPLSTLAYTANAALGRHQIEFVYDDYTLKAATFPSRSYEDVNYDSSQDILKYIADIQTSVGFLNMRGASPEHNFRHNHSLMEQQMRRAFHGWSKMSHPEADGNAIVDGWHDIAVASERAHKVFNTMMTNTSAESYPMIRLPIKGVRGACGSVYPPNGVFYEGCGTDAFRRESDEASVWVGGKGVDPRPGCYVEWEFGQTGANSSMYKWLDNFVGVTQNRHAYEMDGEVREKMLRVTRGEEDPGQMGVNPIDSMQRAFDLLTRPAIHLDELAQVSHKVADGKYLHHEADPRLKDNWELAAFERLRAAYFVASHRNVHGKYTLKMIYQTTPVGGQSRAEGTGGSTPPFLKTFFDQTFGPAMDISDMLLTRGREQVLGSDRLHEIKRMREKLEMEMEQMRRVQAKGLELEKEERSGKCPFTGQSAPSGASILAEGRRANS